MQDMGGSMPIADDPFDSETVLHRGGCSCGQHESQSDHDAAQPSGEQLWRRAVEGAVVRAMFPSDIGRRAFMKTVGSATALAAISQFFPLGDAMEAFAAPAKPENPYLKVGFIPITCATPLVLAAPMGIYSKYGLRVEVVKTPGWAVIRDRSLSKEYDAAHMLSPMPIAMTLGLGSPAMPFTMPAVENINGQAITLAMKHRDKRDPKQWKGFKLGVPFEFSMHNYLLRYYLAENGVDPDQDLQIAAVPPPQMVAKMKAGELDGFLSPDPMNQRAVYDGVGFIHMLSKEIWDGHPCCAFAASEDFIATRPNAAKALLKAIIESTAYANDPANRKLIATFIAPDHLIGQPVEVIEAVLTGKFDDGLGNVYDVPDRIGFDPFPWHSFAVWILTQMKRWGQIKGDVDYAAIARKVYLATDTVQLMRESGLTPPATSFKKFKVMGKEFDPEKPDGYLASFPIKRQL
jgi:nitrate/nitrite transport system substrate-binding protein